MASNKLRDIMADQLKLHPPKDENEEVVLYLDCMIRAFRVQTAEEVRLDSILILYTNAIKGTRVLNQERARLHGFEPLARLPR